MMGQYLMDLKNEPTIHNLLRNMKNTFEYSFHQHHHQMHHHLPMPPQPDQVLDLSKRRDSTETRKTTSPSSFEDGSPDLRNSPSNQATQHLLLRHINMPKPPFTPEHSIQYHYNYEHTSPSSSNPLKTLPSQEIFERFNGTAMSKQENISPQRELKRASPPFYQRRPAEHHHDDSNDLPCTQSNISSSSSSASSQKSPSSSSMSNSGSQMMVVGRDGKLSRPFKAYPRDPLSLAAAGSILDSTSAEKYSVFRKRMLEQIHAANGGNPVINNPKMRRITMKSTSLETNNNEPAFEACLEKLQQQQHETSPSSGHDKDEAYFERRKKNNAAAKKSRDRRRIKEDEIAIRAAFLERENIELKFELAAARKQLTLYSSSMTSS